MTAPNLLEVSVGTRTVLMLQQSSNRDGSAMSGLLTANGLREAGWKTHVAFGFDGPVTADYEAAGHSTYVVPHKNWLRRSPFVQFLKDVAVEWHTSRDVEHLIGRIRPDVVYLNTVVSLAGALAARRQATPCLWHIREMFADVGGEMHAPRWCKPVVRYMIRLYSTVVVTNSAATAENVMGSAALGDVAVVPNAVDKRFFSEARTQEVARCDLGVGEGLIIGVPGSLRPMKGHAFFLRSVAQVLKERPLYSVVITGGLDGEHAVRLKELVNDLGLADQVHFIGWMKDMAAFYRACDIICVPSRAEPFGRTVIEAFACGTPVVATAVGGINETVTHNVTGLLVSFGDEKGLVNAVTRLAENPGLRETLRTSARRIAEDEYHERIYKRRIVTLTERAAASGHNLQGA